MSTQVILLQRVEKLGQMGDVVSVKPGYARNFLLPQKKALRASKENIAYFEAKKKHLESENEKSKSDASKHIAKLEALKVPLVRQASESGQLYGSVTAKDIADIVSEKSGIEVTKAMVKLNENYKTIGLFPVAISLHPEVSVEVTVNIARSIEEAEIQSDTGRALVADGSVQEPDDVQEPEAALEDVLEDSALEAEKVKAEEDAVAAEEDAKKKADKDAKKAAKAESSAEDDAVEAPDAE